MSKNILIYFIFCLLTIKAQAQIVLPHILGHNMVLQQNKPLTIWGKASVGERVNVQFAGQDKTAFADENGKWAVVLKPLKASSTPAELIITGKNIIKLQNILVGEVWLCSGQSNMEYTMRKNSKVKRPNIINENPVDELEFAKNPLIRIFLVNRKELIKPDSLHRGWSIAKDSALRSFSAAAYFFAKELHKNLNVPIGMISSAIPGSRIEPWIAQEAFEASPYFKGQKVEGEPAKFFEPMIRPLIPFAMKGFLWYQGETNCFLTETTEYTQKLTTLINSWRELWGDKTMPFNYVQIAPHTYSESKGKLVLTRETLPAFREAQTNVLKVPHTGMIITTDLVDSIKDIHPSYKWEIGRRLALVALHNDYGMKNIVASGPVFKKMKIKDGVIRLDFEEIGGGLISKDGKALTNFQIAGEDGNFVDADAVIKDNKVLVSSPTISKPVDVRFAWDEAAQPNLFNQEGLPARPFRTK
ncbi:MULTISPECIES: sialate O-acetylesterase [unclassified Arcicella]|uniref:sialate O-acetylesterase n=1 Tax=unclassified Arcicella TaxID=2644986 RepID=UPI00285CA23C|nr:MULTISPECIES: sialate O-acetylesterase [unclassified Arcicella]MDR6561982.1 sialate O-acetylesterase [Arcicella sp. BE51]MDR6811853.1 sialate O-acetylesterase [Arcicella sp. BE140]MDR6822883.1 sialate O-acetylesterase [Arcicella sp. BE139]